MLSDETRQQLDDMITRGRSHQDETFQSYLDEHHVEHWVYANYVDCYISLTPAGHYCGYVQFPKPFLQEEYYYGIVQYVPVHGGVTLMIHNPDNSVTYGFDCAHAGDGTDPNTHDLSWLHNECEKMAQCLALAADGYEQAYLQSQDDQSRAEVIDAYHERLKDLNVAEFVLTDNFNAMINVMFGGKV